MLTHHTKNQSDQILIVDALQRTQRTHIQACILDILRKHATFEIVAGRSKNGNALLRLYFDNHGTRACFTTVRPVGSFSSVSISWIQQLHPDMWPRGAQAHVTQRLLLPWPRNLKDQIRLYEAL